MCLLYSIFIRLIIKNTNAQKKKKKKIQLKSSQVQNE
jgi:hypothetical protein